MLILQYAVLIQITPRSGIPLQSNITAQQYNFRKAEIQLLLYVAVVKSVAAVGAELRRIFGVFGFPAALVALVESGFRRLLCSAFGAEFALVQRAAIAGPAVGLGFGLGFGFRLGCGFGFRLGLGFGLRLGLRLRRGN